MNNPNVDASFLRQIYPNIIEGISKMEIAIVEFMERYQAYFKYQTWNIINVQDLPYITHIVTFSEIKNMNITELSEIQLSISLRLQSEDIKVINSDYFHLKEQPSPINFIFTVNKDQIRQYTGTF